MGACDCPSGTLDSACEQHPELAEDRVVEGVYAVARKRRLRTRAGAPYLALELVDPSGRIEARVWQDVELLDARFAVGDAVRVLGRVERFRDRLQLDVRTLEAADADPAALTPALRRDADELDGFLEFLAGEIAASRARGGDGAASSATASPWRAAGAPGGGRTTATRAGCSSTRSAWRRSAARPRSCTRACAATCCSRRRSSTTSAACASSRAAPAFRPTAEGRLLGHVHLGLRLIEERAEALDPDVRAELLHAVASHHDRARRAPPRRPCSSTRTSSTPSPRRGPVGE